MSVSIYLYACTHMHICILDIHTFCLPVLAVAQVGIVSAGMGCMMHTGFRVDPIFLCTATRRRVTG